MTPDPALLRFAEDLQQEVIAETEASEDGAFREEVFTQRLVDLLQEFEELDDIVICPYKRRGMKVDGYGVSQDDQVLDLVVTHCEWVVPPPNIPRSTLVQVARQCRGFLAECLRGYHERMEPATPAFDLALRIHELRHELTRVRIFVLMDGVCREATLSDEEIDGIGIAYHVWDLERVFRSVSSGARREPIIVDFQEFGGNVPCLAVKDPGGTYTSYLAIIPGDTLAAIYERWGTRLLEKNVRSFLQARGKVNQGIRDCILHEPHMFLTYNNGISVTAEKAELSTLASGQTALARVVDFQIVNGGQTTASIFHAKKKDRAALDAVQVQMKLTVIDRPEAAEEIVPRISRYANTQNRISMADFAANDPFHREVEALSRTVWAPDPAGGKRQTHWFYERARGQYLDERNRAGSPAQARTFETINPRSQLFTKTDLAKFENTWNQLPHLVSRGAQKNFGEFSAQLRERGGFRVEQRYFEDLVAMAIMFRQAERIVSKQAFGGYRANIVAYTLALISNLAAQRIDLQRIWDTQELSPALRAEIERVSQVVHRHITNPPGGRNITEWCKKEDCWTALREAGVTLSKELEAELLPVGRSASKPEAGSRGSDEGDAANLEEVKKIGGATLLELSSWAKVTNNLAAWQRGIVYDVGKRLQQGRVPSRKQVNQALIAYRAAISKGFRPDSV